jgi:UV DNA damage repair endonuclease
LFHISSPLEGWNGPKPERHHDFIDVKDFPECWRRRKITVEIEAKAKEVAVEKLRRDLAGLPEKAGSVKRRRTTLSGASSAKLVRRRGD